jgi:hypothetical protein
LFWSAKADGYLPGRRIVKTLLGGKFGCACFDIFDLGCRLTAKTPQRNLRIYVPSRFSA